MKKMLFIGLLFFMKPAFAALNKGDLMTISTNERFQSRCVYYLNSASIDVIAESTTTARHVERVSYARAAIQGGIIPRQVAANVLTNSTVASEATLAGPDFAIPDSDIQFVINSIFNALAGISN